MLIYSAFYGIIQTGSHHFWERDVDEYYPSFACDPLDATTESPFSSRSHTYLLVPVLCTYYLLCGSRTYVCSPGFVVTCFRDMHEVDTYQCLWNRVWADAEKIKYLPVKQGSKQPTLGTSNPTLTRDLKGLT